MAEGRREGKGEDRAGGRRDIEMWREGYIVDVGII